MRSSHLFGALRTDFGPKPLIPVYKIKTIEIDRNVTKSSKLKFMFLREFLV